MHSGLGSRLHLCRSCLLWNSRSDGDLPWRSRQVFCRPATQSALLTREQLGANELKHCHIGNRGHATHICLKALLLVMGAFLGFVGSLFVQFSLNKARFQFRTPILLERLP